jgi:hypothetical protein
MPLAEYFLLALLGSTPLATGGTVTRNFDADALTQPAGGTPSEAGSTIGGSSATNTVANTNKAGTGKAHKGGRKGHKGGKKGKKSSGGSTTPPPK